MPTNGASTSPINVGNESPVVEPFVVVETSPTQPSSSPIPVACTPRQPSPNPPTSAPPQPNPSPLPQPPQPIPILPQFEYVTDLMDKVHKAFNVLPPEVSDSALADISLALFMFRTPGALEANKARACKALFALDELLSNQLSTIVASVTSGFDEANASLRTRLLDACKEQSMALSVIERRLSALFTMVGDLHAKIERSKMEHCATVDLLKLLNCHRNTAVKNSEADNYLTAIKELRDFALQVCDADIGTLAMPGWAAAYPLAYLDNLPLPEEGLCPALDINNEAIASLLRDTISLLGKPVDRVVVDASVQVEREAVDANIGVQASPIAVVPIPEKSLSFDFRDPSPLSQVTNKHDSSRCSPRSVTKRTPLLGIGTGARSVGARNIKAMQ